ncbi:uncharacterized protein LOC110448266 [Mizuhopecten yessoensis]|uniref:Zinc finger and BTB domain-containing protein 49 n=1 Tax=Mizuhopecten yessoensis TaxID=6573 RepID=A0A210QTM8_MIZYE|nr:uncharacterized protein LOC110448266 [Mizuhopecten yessoensis]OWF52079.1 Zinc finger and BTB domain-containing protein 49 [Mizuhopecten yessoensis]
MKSKGMLNAAQECYEKLDGEETLLESCEEPLDLRLESYQTRFVGLKPGTDNSAVNSSQHSKLDVEISEPKIPQTSVRYADTENKVHTNSKTSQLAGQQGITVIRPKPIYCCRTQNTNGVNTGVIKDHNCSSKTFYQAASASNLNGFNNISNVLKAPHADGWSSGTNVSRGIMGIFRRKANRDLVTKSDQWNRGTELGQEVIKIVNKKPECDLMKLKNADNRKKSPDKLVSDRNVPINNLEVTTNGQYKVSQRGRSAVGMCEIITSFGLIRDHDYTYGREFLDICGAAASDKDMPNHWTCPGVLREARDTSSENDNSFEVLFEYLSNRDEQSSSETLTYTEEAENGNKLPVLQGCEDILDPKPDKDRIVEGGRGIPELVEPTVSPSVDFMEGCRLSPFSVFNQFSHISKHPDSILFPSSSSLSFTSSENEEVDEKEAAFSPHTIRPVATVFPYKEASVETYSTITRPALCHGSVMDLHSEKSSDQQHGKEQKTTTIAAEVNVENTALELSTSRSQPSLPVQHTGGEKELKGRPHHNPGKTILYSSKPTLSFLNKKTTDAIVSSSRMESTTSLSQTKLSPLLSPKEFKLSSPTESTVFSNRESVLPLLQKEWTLFSLRESGLPSLHEESTRFSLRESALPSLHRESNLIINLPSLDGGSALFPNIESNLSSTAAESLVSSSQGESSNFERDMKTLSMFSANLEESGQGILQKMTSIGPNSPVVQSPNPVSSMPKLQIHSSSTPKATIPISMYSSGIINSPVLTSVTNSPIVSSLPNSPMITCMPNAPTLISMPNLPIDTCMPNSSTITSMPNPQMLTSMSNLPISTSPMPNSPILTSVPSLHVLTSSMSNSHILASLQNSPVFSSSRLNLPNSQVLTSSVPNSPSLIYSIPKLPILTATVPKSPSPKISSVSNLNIQIAASVPNSPISNVCSPSSSTEKYKQQGTRLSPPMKHKQMLIEKYKMSVNTEKTGGESRIDQCDTELYEITGVENSTVDFPRTRIAGKGGKHKPFQTDKCLSFSETENQANSCSPAKERKLSTQESKYYCESVCSNQSLQSHDLEPCETFYWCHVCEKTVKCEKDANRHQNIHGYNTKANLIFYYLQVYGCVTLHWRGYNRAEKCVYLCGLCDKTIPYISGFKRHIQTHGPNVCCEVCSKCFDDNESLLEHKFSHSESKSCEENGDQGFASRTNKHGYNRNGSSATNKCRFCGKFFSSRSSLSTHVRLHTGQNPYKCRLCDRSYPQNVQLKLHMKVHNRLGDVKD